MRLGNANELELRIVQSSANHGATELELSLDFEGELPPDASTMTYSGAVVERLDLDDVHALRDACDDVLEGRPLPR